MYCSLIRYVLENYGYEVLFGPMVLHTKKNPPPIEFVPGRFVLETKCLLKARDGPMYIYVPSFVTRYLLKQFSELDIIKKVGIRKSSVFRVLVLVEALPPVNDIDILRELAEYYEGEAAKYRDMFKASKLREVFAKKLDASYAAWKTVTDILDRL